MEASPPRAENPGRGAGPAPQPAIGLGGGDAIDQVGAPADQAVQVAVDDVDFLPQIVELGRVHKPRNSFAGEAILRPGTGRKAPSSLKALACLPLDPYTTPSVEFEPTGLRPR